MQTNGFELLLQEGVLKITSRQNRQALTDEISEANRQTVSDDFKAVRLRLKVYYGSSAGQSPAGKNPHPSYLWACTVFLPASAQSTLLLFFFCHTFCKRQKRRLHGDLSRS